jgi:5-methylthioadenosine/S-adenosylhomocysteine deaminase
MLLLARYVLPVAGPHIEDGAVLVRGDSIEAVGTRDELLAANPAEEVRDFGLAAIIPGFVDLHTHLEYSAFRGAVDDVPYTSWKMHVLRREDALSQDDWADSALLGAMEALQSGITTIADITDTGVSATAAAVSGLAGVVYREVSTMDKGLVGEEMDAAVADIDAWSSATAGSLVEIGIAPHSPYTCHPALFRAVADLAGERGLAAAIHLAGSKDEYDFVRYGSSPLAQDFRTQAGWRDVAWMPTGVSPVRYVLQWGLFELDRLLAVHCTQVDEEDVEILASHGVPVAHCPRCNAKLGMGIAPLSLFFKHGVTVGIGTDSPASNNTIDMFDEMRFGMLLQRGRSSEAEFFKFFTARTFTRLATYHGARALRLDTVTGSLEAGKRADIAVVDLSSSHQVPTQDPYGALVHTANQENVRMTMVGGRVLYEDGAYHTLDSERLLARAEELRVKLRSQ